MQKIIKRIALLTVALAAVLCMGIFASACSSTEYTITVYYSDGKTVVDGTKDNISVTICDATGEFCFIQEPKVDANGVVKFNIAEVNAAAENAGVTDHKYVVHVWAGREELTLKEKVTVDSSNASVKVILSDRTAQ